MNQVIRVLIVDDHFVVREGLRFILEGYPEIELVGDAGDGNTAISFTVLSSCLPISKQTNFSHAALDLLFGGSQRDTHICLSN